jgi:hypothetical protein
VAAGITCNPLAPEWDCLMPYPSDLYRRVDALLPGGHRVELPPEVQLENHTVDPPQRFDFFEMFPADGFSVLPQIGLRLGGPISTEGLVGPMTELGPSMSATSRTLLIDAETGEFQPHFVEYDARPANDEDRTLMIRPAWRLQNGRRYVVALQGLERPDGTPVAAPSGFRALRDGEPNNEVMKRLERYFDDRVFPVLASKGISRDRLQLAWDFTTQSFENAAGDLLRVRELALESFRSTPIEVEVTRVVDYRPDEQDGNIRGRLVRGRLRVPLFTVQGKPDSARTADDKEDPADDQAGARLFRDAAGRVAQNGFSTADFTLVIPRSVVDGTKPGPARLLQFGHGFFGGRDELLGYAADFANRTGMVIAGVDWTGSTSIDAATIYADLLSDPASCFRFVERTHQGMVNFLALAEAAKTTLRTVPAMQLDGRLVIETDGPVYYYGISQGHILGTTYLALAPHIDRAALSVGGMSFGFMMSRSRNFMQFLGPIDRLLGDEERRAEATRLVMLQQTVFEKIDPVTYAPFVRENTLPGSPPRRQLLMQIGVGDAQVPNLATHLQARTMGLPLLTPAPRSIWGIAETAGPAEEALVEFDFGLPMSLEARPAENDNPVHEGVRRTRAAIAQIDGFLRPGGLIEVTCRDAAGTAAACVCRGPAPTCDPIGCVAEDDRCEGNDLLTCETTTGHVARVTCAGGCDPGQKRCL